MATRRICQNSFATTLDVSVSSHEQDSCAICLGVPENKSFANNCLHEFCFNCLLKWSKVRAECPMCMQPFSSIIHSVRSDNEYHELEIHMLDKPVPKVLPETVLPAQLALQQQVIQPLQLPIQSDGQAVASSDLPLFPLMALHQQTALLNQATTALQQSADLLNQATTSAFAGGSVSFVRTVRPRPTPHATTVAKKTQNLMPAHGLAHQAHQQVTAAQGAPLSHKEDFTNHYSLRSKVPTGNIPDVNVRQLVNEFCPLDSSTPLRPCRLQLSQVTANPAEKSKWWHHLVNADMRNKMVQELVQAIIPDPSFMNQNEIETVVAYTQELEIGMYKTAESKQQYTLFHSGKTKVFRTDMDQKHKRAFIQRILSSESVVLDLPLDLSSPRSKITGFGNQKAPGADKRLSVQILAEEDEDENDESQNDMFFSDGSSGRNGSSEIEERDGRAFDLQQPGQGSFVEDESEEIVILEMPPKHEPELIILSDSDDE